MLVEVEQTLLVMMVHLMLTVELLVAVVVELP